MADLIIDRARLMLPGGVVEGASVWVSRGTILGISPEDELSCRQLQREHTRRVDAGGRLLTPGLIDLHIHGIEHHLFESGPEALIDGVSMMPRHGVTTVLPTLYRCLGRSGLVSLYELTRALGAIDQVHVPGFHMEGPFLKLAGAGGHTMTGDLTHLEALLDAAGDRVSAMSISPDTDQILGVIRRLVQRGVQPFITHTRADVQQSVDAIEAGARHATHFYNVFEPPAQTEPGVHPTGCIETVLGDPRVSVDLIADGVHVHPMAVRAAVAAKGGQGRGVIAISDANIGAGLGEGVFPTSWGYPVRIQPGDAARIDLPGDPRHGCIAGSAITLAQAVANLRQWLDLPEHRVWAMATTNPADLMGWPSKGRLATGADADLVLWDEDAQGGLTAACTWLGGRCVYERRSLVECRL